MIDKRKLIGQELKDEIFKVANDPLYFYNTYCLTGIDKPITRDQLAILLNPVLEMEMQLGEADHNPYQTRIGGRRAGRMKAAKEMVERAKWVYAEADTY